LGVAGVFVARNCSPIIDSASHSFDHFGVITTVVTATGREAGVLSYRSQGKSNDEDSNPDQFGNVIA
jgi:hypothetical protein